MSTKIVTRKLEKENAILHSIACNICHNGGAEVDKYFKTCTRVVDNETGIFKASFRGRCLMGKNVQLPDGYKGVVLKEKASVYSDQQDRTLEITEHFDQMTYWNLETKPTQNDQFVTSMDWLSAAQVLHASVDDLEEGEEVNKENDSQPKCTPPER